MIANKGKNAKRIIDDVIPRLWNAYPAQEYPMMPPIHLAARNRDIPLPRDSFGTKSVTSADPTLVLTCMKALEEEKI